MTQIKRFTDLPLKTTAFSGNEVLALSDNLNSVKTTINNAIPFILTGTFSSSAQVNYIGISNLLISGSYPEEVVAGLAGNLYAATYGDSSVNGNQRGAGAVDWQQERTTSTQVASGQYSVIAGGRENTADDSYSTVVGGYLNNSLNDYTFVGGGRSNTANQDYAVVAGGRQNLASQNYTSITGGRLNTASAEYATVVGGANNKSTAESAFVGGGNTNISSGVSSTLVGGFVNTSSGSFSFVGGGTSNSAKDYASIVVGGQTNVSDGMYSYIGGGLNNAVSASCSVIVGGNNNKISASYGYICGGQNAIVDRVGMSAQGTYNLYTAGKTTENHRKIQTIDCVLSNAGSGSVFELYINPITSSRFSFITNGTNTETAFAGTITILGISTSGGYDNIYHYTRQLTYSTDGATHFFQSNLIGTDIDPAPTSPLSITQNSGELIVQVDPRPLNSYVSFIAKITGLEISA